MNKLFRFFKKNNKYIYFRKNKKGKDIYISVFIDYENGSNKNSGLSIKNPISSEDDLNEFVLKFQDFLDYVCHNNKISLDKDRFIFVPVIKDERMIN